MEAPQNKSCFAKPPYLQYIRKLNKGTDQLNVVENYILNVADETKPNSKHQLVGNLLKNQEDLGFGDSQYFQKLDVMKSLFTSFHPVE